MALTVNSNIASLSAQRTLGASTNALSTSLERLSSGSRINSAKDDAAGMQIANRLTSQINGLGVAVKNANDGISIAQTAEGALQESNSILQRMRDLSLQAANGSNGATERQALNDEVKQLQQELNRIATTTTFGGQQLLDGTFGTKNFQVGSNANETIAVNIRGASAKNMGADRFDMAGTGFGAIGSKAAAAADADPSANIVAGDLTITGSNGKDATAKLVEGDSAKAVAAKINAHSDTTAVTATARTGVQLSNLAAPGNVSMTLGNGKAADDATISANIADTTDLTALADAINAQAGKTGITAELTDSNTKLKLVSETGDDIVIKGFAIAGVAAANATTPAALAQLNSVDADGKVNAAGTTLQVIHGDDVTNNAVTDATIRGHVRLESAGAFQVEGENAGMVGTETLAVSTLTSVDTIDISTQEGAQNAISVIDAAIAGIDKNRASLGAIQGRFESTISNLQNISENVTAARGRIMDTDYAAESANLTKNQIMQQAGTAMLAQANQLPQAVLSLLG